MVRQFAASLDRHIAAMSAAIREGTFPVGRFQQFLIREPKERVITAPCFDERVLHHAIMNVCEPVMDRWLIDDTFALPTHVELNPGGASGRGGIDAGPRTAPSVWVCFPNGNCRRNGHL